MTTYRITAPDGKTYQIEGPPGASDADVARAVIAQFPNAGKPSEPAAVSKIKGLFPAPVADVLHQVADVPIGFQKGIARGIRAVSDIFGADNAFSKSVKQNEEALANLMSAQSKNDQQEIARILKEAEDKGVLDQIKAGVKAFTVAPVDTLTSAFGTAAPAIVAALGAKVLGAGALLTTGVSMATGAGMGAGTIKGTIYEETKKALEEAGVPEPIAEERAKKAQEYGGQNLDQILAGAAIGGVAAKGPLEKGVVRAIASRISKNVAAREAAESVSEKVAKGAATGRIRAGVAEALPEAGQAAQEQIAANIAQQREGLDVPTFRGAVAAGTMEGLAGGVLGATFGGDRAPVAPPPGAAPAAPGSPGETPIERAAREAAEKAPTSATTEAPATTEAAPPVAETPAPLIEEPKVRKPDEPPAGGMQPADIEALGISKKQPIYRRMLGKDLENPEQRAAVLADVENYLTKGNGSEESRAKLAEFKAKFAPPPVVETPAVPPAEPAVEAPVGEAPTPPAAAPTIQTVPVTAIYDKHTDSRGITNAGAVADEIVAVAEDALNKGQTVNYVVEGKSHQIVAIKNGMMQDNKGQRWGTLLLTRDRNVPDGARLQIGTPAVELAPVPETPSVTTTPTEPEAGGAGAPVVSQPDTGAAPEGVGAVEPTGVVPPVADVGQPAGREEAKPAAVVAPTITTPAAEAPVAPKEKVLKGSVENRIKALNVNAAQGGVPDPKVIRSTLESINEPKMARAVLYYLGVDQDGNFLVGANNLPQTPSAQEAGQMAGLGENSGDRVKKVAKALGITGDIRKKYQASQTDILVTGAAVSESGTGADVEPAKTGLITEQAWYEPIARKGVGQANDTELARAAVRADRFLENRANEPTHAAIMAEVQNRAKRPEFRSALKKEFGIASEEATVEEGTPGTEAGVEEEGGEEPTYRTIPQSPVVTNRASHAELEKVVTDIGKMLGGKVDVTILDDVTDVDAKQKPGSRAGATIKGGIYLFRSGIAKGIEGQKTIFHELFHKGLKNLLPEAEYRAMMNKFYSQSAEIRAMADAYLASDVGKGDTKNLSPQDARILAVEESLAEIAEKTDLKPTLVRQVGNFLARVADRLGMPQLARAIRTMGLNEQEKFIRDALQAGMGPSKAGEGAARFRTAITPEAEKAAAEADAIGERKQTTLTEKVGRELQGNTALRLREKFTDSMASLEDFFVNAYGGQIRTAGGRLNPMVLLSRALDALRVSKAVQEQGGLGREDGLIVATELKNDKGESISYQGVLKRIADAAKAEGKTYEEYQKIIDNVLYGHREFNLRERNKTLDADEQVDLLLDDKQIDALEAAFQKDEFIKGISADLDAIRFNLLDTLVETGRISKEQAQDYKDAVGYIPFERIGDYENAWTGATRGANRGAAALKKMRKLEGSNRKSTSVVENFSGLVDWATKEAMKNEAASRALEDMVLLGAAKRGPKPATDSPGGEVQVFKDGKLATFYVPDPAHLVAFSLADPQLSKILKAFQRGAQVLRAGVTSMPPFAIKQVFDDVVRAYTYAGVKNNAALVRNVLFNFPKNWMNEILKRKPEGIRELEALGIVGTFDFSQQGGNLQNILEGAGAKKEGLGSTILRVMEAGAKASDVAVREAIYKQVLKETGDKAQAESAAREIINFSRRGSSKMMGQMISIIPFFNAYARGMDKLATAAAGKVVGQTTGTARSMFYSRMAVLTAMGLAYALMMQDDEEYNKLPDHVRDTNWILPYGKELGFTPAIPIPADLAFFFKAIPERLVRYYKYQGTDEERTAMEVLGELTKRGIDVFSSPNITPQILRPFIENMVNYSWFLGRPLESQAQLKLRPFERYGTGTSDAMKAVAEILEDAANATGIEAFAVSPIKLENAVRGLLGSAAGLSLSVADMVVNPSRTDRPLHQQLVPQLTGAAAVMKNPVGTRYMDEIYSLEKKTEQVYTTYNRLKENDPDKAEQFLDANIGMYEIRPAVRAVMEQIRDLNKMAMAIDKDTTMSPEERRKEIDELRAEQNEIARVVFSLRKEARDIQMGL